MAGATNAVVAASAPIASPITTRPNDTVHPFGLRPLFKTGPNMESCRSDPIVTRPIANLVRLLPRIHRIATIARPLAGVAGPL
ncbi:hypothetical protein SPKIRA_23440 [Sphingomonas paucimobilis]|nr:hypothetical protein SPKIRA_23440 [Sphingomonas paucimobilis]